jgi:hypothetical protein
MANRKTIEEALEAAALAGANEVEEFLGTYRGSDAVRIKRAQIGLGAMGGFTRWKASQNNLMSMMLAAARQTGVPPEKVKEIAKSAGLLPPSVE